MADGFLDIAKTNFSGDLPSLFLSEDGRFFRDSAQDAELGAHQLLGWGAAFLDVDEDGLHDLIMANGSSMSRHRSIEIRRTLPSVSLALSKCRRRKLRKFYYGDGRPDVYVSNMWTAPGQTITRNPAKSAATTVPRCSAPVKRL